MVNANIVIVGHIDHGKSTLIGRLLYDSQSIKGKKIEEIKKVAEEYKKRFEFAHLLDSLEEEVKGEKTIDTTQVFFKGKNFYTIIDAPGHKEFLKNMLTGASYAHAAVTVVSAPDGIMEQTRRHLFLLNFLGLRQLFICVNKLDELAYKEEIFEKLVSELKTLLETLKYKPDTLMFIPISALEGDNVFTPSSKMAWYKGPTLIGALDQNIIVREQEGTYMRFVVQDVYDVEGDAIAVGRVESGSLKENDEVIFLPSGLETTVQGIKVWNAEVQSADQGDSIGIVLKGTSKIRRGDVCGLKTSQPSVQQEFTGQMFLLADSLDEGDSLFVKCATNKVKCTVSKILQKIDSETGKEMPENPTHLEANEAAVIQFKTDEPIVIEKYSLVPALGRFILEKNNKNIAAGIIP